MPLDPSTAIAIGGDILGGFLGGGGADKATNAMRNAAAADLRFNKNVYRNTRQDLAPYRNMGVGATSIMNDSLPGLISDLNTNFSYKPIETGYEYEAINPEFAADTTFDMDDFNADPGYQFRQSEGEKAINRFSASRGGFNSGATIKDLLRYNQGFASDEFGKAYGRFTDTYNRKRDQFEGNYARGANERMFDYGVFADNYNRDAGERGFDYGVFTDTYNRDAANKDRKYGYLRDLMALGQGAATGTGAAGIQAGSNVSQALSSMGNSQAAGAIAKGNIWGETIGSIGDIIAEEMRD